MSTEPTRKRFDGSNQEQDFEHEVLEVARVVRVVKGGRRFRFRATVIIGDKQGGVGLGIGKSRDVQQAIEKAQEQANRNKIKVQLHEGTINHTTKASYKGAQVLLRPAKPGTGVIAGGAVRTVADLAGISDMVGKRYGSTNKLSNAKATIKALESIKG